mmetsp:Transcript_11333/g.34170  ORF Transcript_11333/g.34170 Transcript_11333/m.34170 type:complete len:281 (+) Transcript_11333:3933-4775(+)
MALTISWPSQGGSQAGHGSRSKVGEDPLLPIGDIELDKARDEDPRDEDPKETAPALEATVEPTAAMAGEPAAGDQAAEATAPADLRTAMDTEPASSGTETAEKEPASQEPSPSGASWSRIPTLSELKEAQKEDKYCLEVLSNPTMYSGDQAPYFIENDILYHRHVTDVGGMNMLVVPDCYRVSLMTMIHCAVGGHLGQAKTVNQVRKMGFWWSGMHRTAKYVVHNCRGCQFASAHRNTTLGTEGSRFISMPQHKWEIVSFDLQVMDNFSKFVTVIPLKSM